MCAATCAEFTAEGITGVPVNQDITKWGCVQTLLSNTWIENPRELLPGCV